MSIFRAPLALLVASSFLLSGCMQMNLGFPTEPVFGGSKIGQSRKPTQSSTQSSGSDSFSLFGGTEAVSGGGGGGGYVVGDEPFAVKAGQRILEEGGTAADAAAAIYFALSVTYPVAAGLGGGGICIVSDRASGRGEAFDFLPRNAQTAGAYAVPGNVRGFALVQAAYGVLPWQRVVAPAESYAATGVPISRALADRLAVARDVIRTDTALASIYLDGTGNARSAGSVAVNPALAETLGEIRIKGASGFYEGAVADSIAGFAVISRGELDAYRAGRGIPYVTSLGGDTIYLPPQRTGSGAFAAVLLRNLAAAGSADQAAVAKAVREALASFGVSSIPGDLGSTGFAAMDRNGQAVSCAVTLNGPFGAGRLVPGSGILLARSPATGQVGLAPAFLTPAIMLRDSSVSLAGAGSGGPNGSAAIAYAIAKLSRGESVTRPGDIRSTGMAPYDTVNAIVCQTGVCAAMSDPGASGMGAAAN